MYRFLFLLLFVALDFISQSHPWKPNHFIIIGTNGSADDMPAINYFFSNPECRVLGIAIHTQDSNPDGYFRVKQYLDETFRQGVLVGFNSTISGNQSSKNDSVIICGTNPKCLSNLQLFRQILAHVSDPISFVNINYLQPIKLYADSVPGLVNQLKELVWFTSKDYVDSMENSFMLNFLNEKNIGWRMHLYQEDDPNSYEQIFSDTNATRYKHNQSFQLFPMDTAAYQHDIAPHVNNLLSKFGYNEWTACVLTNEIHRHVGIYAIVGAKMGVRALEFFSAGVDEVRAISYAGSQPPLSCLNDGIQVSTGATVGHGLITIAKDEPLEPKVIFEYLGQKICVELKPDYKNQLQADVKQLAQIHGLNNTIYWDLIRKMALNCWFSWDRHQIFSISCIPD